MSTMRSVVLHLRNEQVSRLTVLARMVTLAVLDLSLYGFY